MGPQKAKRLASGDTLGVVSPSSPTTRDSDLERFRRWAAEHELTIKIFEHARDRHGYLAGTDEARAHDITAAFADSEVDAVVTMRGGTGGWRMVPYVDYEIVRANPKLFVGYSDITALHVAIGARADLITFYGPSVSSFIGRGASPYTLRNFLRVARDPAPLGEIEKDPDDPFTWSITPGVAEGTLRGGCLTLLAQSLGTPWEVEWDGCVVFVEDIGEEPYRIDGYMTQLRLAGKLDRIAGFVVGEHVDCGPKQFRPSYPYGTFSTEDVYRQHLEPLGVPAMVGLPCGHGKHLATLPLGARARLDADRCTLEVLEPATV